MILEICFMLKRRLNTAFLGKVLPVVISLVLSLLAHLHGSYQGQIVLKSLSLLLCYYALSDLLVIDQSWQKYSEEVPNLSKYAL